MPAAASLISRPFDCSLSGPLVLFILLQNPSFVVWLSASRRVFRGKVENTRSRLPALSWVGVVNPAILIPRHATEETTGNSTLSRPHAGAPRTLRPTRYRNSGRAADSLRKSDQFLACPSRLERVLFISLFLGDLLFFSSPFLSFLVLTLFL